MWPQLAWISRLNARVRPLDFCEVCAMGWGCRQPHLGHRPKHSSAGHPRFQCADVVKHVFGALGGIEMLRNKGKATWRCCRKMYTTEALWTMLSLVFASDIV
ncbi:hypothetical protein FKP32DRAFT_1595558 [Trametes sanguinea]|nr:hypothetical protein FKP32DRAFT_1595558 [Trametes sanguinea]